MCMKAEISLNCKVLQLFSAAVVSLCVIRKGRAYAGSITWRSLGASCKRSERSWQTATGGSDHHSSRLLWQLKRVVRHVTQSHRHHPEVHHLPLTAHLHCFPSSFTTAICQSLLIKEQHVTPGFLFFSFIRLSSHFFSITATAATATVTRITQKGEKKW